MSYHVLQKPANIYEAAAGMGAFVRTFPSDPYRRGGVARVVRTSRWGVPFAYQGFGGIEFSGAAVRADIMACLAAGAGGNWNVAACKWPDTVRAALAQLGYGNRVGKGSWVDADAAVWKQWCDKNGVPYTFTPSKDALLVMEQHVAQNNVTGTKPHVEQAKVGDTYVPATTMAPAPPSGDTYVPATTMAPAPPSGDAAKPGLSMVGMGLVAVGLIGIAAIAIAARRKGRVQPVSGPLTASPVPARA